MRRLAIFVLALAFGAPACDDDNPVGPSNSGPIVFTAELRASNEVPAIRRSGEHWCRISSAGARDHHVQRPAGRVGKYHG